MCGTGSEVNVLNDRERSVLNDIENRLDAEDPALAEQLKDTGEESEKPRRRYWIAAGILALLLLISIGAKLPIATLVLAMGLCGALSIAYIRAHQAGRAP